MQVQNICLQNNFESRFGVKKSSSNPVISASFTSSEAKPPSKKKKDETLKYFLLGLGAILTIIAIVNHKKIGEFFKKSPKSNTDVKPEVKSTAKSTSSSSSSSARSNSRSNYSSSKYTTSYNSSNSSSKAKPDPNKSNVVDKTTDKILLSSNETPAISVPTNTHSDVTITDEEIQKALNGIMGTPEETAQKIAECDAIAAVRADEISKKVKSFPELIVHKDELWDIAQKNKVKWKNKQLDLDYYKDEFRAYTTISVDRLNNLRESTNPELKKMFDLDRTNFTISDGIMVHGSDRPEKKALFNHFVSEAEKHGMRVIRLEAGDSDPHKFAQQVAKLFSEAKKRFQEEKIATMLVMEDMDKMLNLRDPKLSAAGSVVRGQINRNADQCGRDGVMWVSTVKDISQIDPSCYDGGGGRVSYVIDIDKVA